MCRNIKPLFNFDPPATDEEIRDAALQFVRKLSGTTKPSKRNEAAFDRAVSSIAACARELLDSLETSHPPVFYLPPAAVRTDLLVASDRRTVCEFKGVAHYWDLVLPDLRVPDVAWSYPEPTPSYVDIAGALAFYAGKVDRCLVDDEEVTPQASDFYGGWVTKEIRL